MLDFENQVKAVVDVPLLMKLYAEFRRLLGEGDNELTIFQYILPM